MAIRINEGPERGCLVVFIGYDRARRLFVGKANDVGVVVSAATIPLVLTKLAKELERFRFSTAPIDGRPGKQA